jgi:molecular chaperone GrpE
MSQKPNPEQNQDLSASAAAGAQAHTDAGAATSTAEGASSNPSANASATPEEALAAAQAQIAKLTEIAAVAQDQALRAKAEMENIRKRAQLDVAAAHKYASEGFAESLLPVKDSLEAALAHAAKEGATLADALSGVELTLKQLVAAFEKAKVVEVNPVGEKLDPNKHQSLSMAPSDLPANHVVSVMQKGYQLNDRLLRPALVVVSAPK